MKAYMMSLFLSLLLLFSSSKLLAVEINEKGNQPFNVYQAHSVIEWAKDHLPWRGVLKEDRKGFVYLKVDDGYIDHLFPRLDAHGYSKPEYFRRFDSPGAHVSVFYVNERHKTGEIREIGQEYSFKIIGIAAVPPKTQEYIVLEVESPGLEQLREKYGLSPLLQGHQFHITIAKKKRRY